MSGASNVLLVEDDHLVLDATAQTLRDGGCVVRTATSYDEAIGALDDHRDLTVVVTDIVLEGSRSGLDLIGEARSRNPQVGIILLSGQVRPASESLPDDALFCTKPCAPGALLRLVQESRDW